MTPVRFSSSFSSSNGFRWTTTPQYSVGMLKYWRIAVTAFSLTACVLLVVLWVRSYWWLDTVNGVLFQGAPSLALMSCRGQIHLTLMSENFPSGWAVTSVELAKYPDVLTQFDSTFGFAFSITPRFLLFSVPNWFAIAISGVVSAVPWLKSSNRFSLRTLLIVTTLVAVLLGIVVTAGRF
jgi:hypothetical protein